MGSGHPTVIGSEGPEIYVNDKNYDDYREDTRKAHLQIVEAA